MIFKLRKTATRVRADTFKKQTDARTETYVTVIVGCPTREEFVDIWLINDGSDTYIANSKLLTTIEKLLHTI